MAARLTVKLKAKPAEARNNHSVIEPAEAAH